jgi:hypothetical protein
MLNLCSVILYFDCNCSNKCFIFFVEMKRIARNAGKVLAVNLNYHTSHEVAQVCYGHIWRKRVSLCCRFEELLFLIRILESSLDREVSEFVSCLSGFLPFRTFKNLKLILYDALLWCR